MVFSSQVQYFVLVFRRSRIFPTISIVYLVQYFVPKYNILYQIPCYVVVQVFGPRGICELIYILVLYTSKLYTILLGIFPRRERPWGDLASDGRGETPRKSSSLFQPSHGGNFQHTPLPFFRKTPKPFQKLNRFSVGEKEEERLHVGS